MTGVPGRVMVIIWVIVLCAMFIVVGIQTMQAAAQATFSVTNLNDSGPGSLRQAILDANATPGADVIHITANGQLNLLATLPTIHEAVTIFVPDANTFRVFKIDGQNLHRGLTIAAVPVTITGLTVQNSVATGDLRGGGIKSDGPLTLNSVTILNNNAQAVGGGVFSTGAVTVNGGRFEGNEAWENGGGIFATGPLIINGGVIRDNQCVAQFCQGGELYASQALTLTNTQIISNTALQSGGGVAHHAGDSLILNTLFAGNTASESGAAVALQGSGTDHITHVTIAATEIVTGTAVATTKEILLLRNTIVVSHAVGLQVTSGLVVLDSTLFHGNSVDIQGNVGFDQNRIGADLLFVNPGAGNYRLQPGSPAIDAGLDLGVLVDFEGDARPSLNGFDIGYDEFTWFRLLLPIVVRAAYRNNYARLAQVKAKYDAHNLFRVNQNISPAR